MAVPRFLILSLVACGIIGARADELLEGYTVLKGDGYAFELKAPLGWILDDKVGNAQGLNVVFYPEHADWDKSDVVCFPRVRSLDNERTAIENQIKEPVKTLREHRDPNAED